MLRGGAVIGCYEPTLEGGGGGVNCSTSSSLYDFPTASLNSKLPGFIQLCRGVSEYDLIRITVEPDGGVENVIFEGEFRSKTESKKDGEHEVSLEAVHSCFRLSLVELHGAYECAGRSFGDIVSEVFKISKVQSRIEVSQELSHQLVHGSANSSNAFKFIKEICFVYGVVATFRPDNSVLFDFRKNVIARYRSMTPVDIREEDVVSVEVRQNIAE